MAFFKSTSTPSPRCPLRDNRITNRDLSPVRPVTPKTTSPLIRRNVSQANTSNANSPSAETLRDATDNRTPTTRHKSSSTTTIHTHIATLLSRTESIENQLKELNSNEASPTRDAVKTKRLPRELSVSLLFLYTGIICICI